VRPDPPIAKRACLARTVAAAVVTTVLLLLRSAPQGDRRRPCERPVNQCFSGEVTSVAVPAAGDPGFGKAPYARRAARLTDPAKTGAFVSHNRFATLLDVANDAQDEVALRFPPAAGVPCRGGGLGTHRGEAALGDLRRTMALRAVTRRGRLSTTRREKK
jgi:hypothetical protein